MPIILCTRLTEEAFDEALKASEHGESVSSRRCVCKHPENPRQECHVLLCRNPVAGKTGAVKTKSLYAPPEYGDGERVLISRYWPKSMSKAKLKLSPRFGWIRELGPSVALLKDWKDGRFSWDQYTSRYHKEMKAQTDFINTLAEAAKTRTITLLCFEKEDDPHCHRHLLKEVIEEAQGKSD